MESLKELLSILKDTPETALWGIGFYFLFMLLKLAGWVGALTVVVKMFITRYFDATDKKTQEETERAKHALEFKGLQGLADKLSREVIGDHTVLVGLLDVIKRGGSGYVHKSDIDRAIRILTAPPTSE